MPNNCEVCQSDKHIKLVFRNNGLAIVKCKSCGLHFVKDNFDLTKLSELYKENMYETYWKYESGFYEKHWQEMESHEDDIINDLDKESLNINKFYRKGKLLDVGCFKGHFCKIMNDRGWDVTGVDISKDAVEYGKNKFELNLYCGELSEFNFQKNSFDVITLWGVIEHFKEPRATVKQIYPLLKKNGLLIVKTQSQSSFLTILALLLYKISFGEVKSHLDFFYSQEHLFRFSPKNLRVMLESEGFKQKEITYDSAYIIKFALKSAKFYIKFPVKLLDIISRLLIKQDKMTIYALKK